MDSMFEQASSFNRDLSKWDVSRVNNMKLMFSGASSFKGVSALLSAWDNMFKLSLTTQPSRPRHFLYRPGRRFDPHMDEDDPYGSDAETEFVYFPDEDGPLTI